MPTARFVPVPLILLALAGCSQSKQSKPQAGEKTSTVSTSPSSPAASKAEPSANGTGCPAGTAKVTRDGNTVTVTFDKFVAETSGDTKVSMKDCLIAIPTPGDKQYAIGSFNMDGEMTLEKGANAKVWFDTYVQGKPDYMNTTQRDHDGPHDKPLLLTHKLTADQLIWSECGAARSLNSTARVRIAAKDDASTDPVVGKAKPTKLTMQIEERPCSGS